MLDGRVLRTPARNPLQFPSKELAMLVAGEWDAQTDPQKGNEPISMPIMTLSSTAIDQLLYNESSSLTNEGDDDSRQFIIQNCLKYLPTDSLLFFTNSMDRILLNKQRKTLLPVIKALNRRFKFTVEPTSEMISKISHPPATTERIEKILQRMVKILFSFFVLLILLYIFRTISPCRVFKRLLWNANLSFRH
jgi:chaperone required for assembly of F1-ATPase